MDKLKQFLIWTLRKASYRWPPRQEALRRASVSAQEAFDKPGEKIGKRIRNFYRCNFCGYVFSRKGVCIDHIEPVVNPRKGWQGWTEYIERMFVGVEGFQILCNECHDEKTAKERKLRFRKPRSR